MIEVGRICMKIAGREAGNFCIVVKVIDKTFVEVTGPKQLTGIKRRKCNIMHLQQTPYKIEIKEGASDKKIIEELKKSNLMKKLGLKIKKS
jgi:large subunit ribosomal protein L14e